MQGFRRVISIEHQLHYLQHGYAVMDAFISADWLDRLNHVTAEYIDKSKQYKSEDVTKLGQRHPTDPLADKLMLAEGHSSSQPMLTRLAAPVELHDTYWDFCRGPMADIASDFLGPNVRFHHSKLNFKWPGSLEEIHWHQDIQFWPHSNYNTLTIGVYLDDVSEEMGPMRVVPLSAYDQLHPLTNPTTNEFTGVLSHQALAQIPLDKAASTAGAAGTVTVHNARCVHSSVPNTSSKARPLLLMTFANANAKMLKAGTNLIHLGSRRGTPIVRGTQEVETVVDPRPCPMAPDFSSGYVSPFIKRKDG